MDCPIQAENPFEMKYILIAGPRFAKILMKNKIFDFMVTMSNWGFFLAGLCNG